jgi:hypothetical protein
MDADAETWRGARQLDSRCERRSVGEQGRAGDDSVAMGFSDAAVNAFGPAQVIRIDD